MTTEYFADAATGAFLGVFVDGARPSAPAVEVPHAPRQGDAVWNGRDWVYPPPPVPQVIRRFQARAALLQAGLLEQAEAAVMAADALTRIAWIDAVEFRRASPTIASLATVLGLPCQRSLGRQVVGLHAMPSRHLVHHDAGHQRLGTIRPFASSDQRHLVARAARISTNPTASILHS